jgi:hypothetical protein
MPRPAGPQPRAPTARASRDDSRQGPTPHRAAPDLSLVRWRPRSLRTQPSWRRWLAWPRLGGARAPAAFQFMSWLALLPPFSILEVSPFLVGRPFSFLQGAPSALSSASRGVYRRTPTTHAGGMHGHHALALLTHTSSLAVTLPASSAVGTRRASSFFGRLHGWQAPYHLQDT